MNFLKMSVMASSVTFLLVTGSSGLQAQPRTCGPRNLLTEALAQRYQEHMDWAGLSNAGTLVELYVSDSGTWTIIVSNVDGQSCIVAAGEYWDRPRPPSTDV